jgi:hypothetical protein
MLALHVLTSPELATCVAPHLRSTVVLERFVPLLSVPLSPLYSLSVTRETRRVYREALLADGLLTVLSRNDDSSVAYTLLPTLPALSWRVQVRTRVFGDDWITASDGVTRLWRESVAEYQADEFSLQACVQDLQEVFYHLHDGSTSVRDADSWLVFCGVSPCLVDLVLHSVLPLCPLLARM